MAKGQRKHSSRERKAMVCYTDLISIAYFLTCFQPCYGLALNTLPVHLRQRQPELLRPTRLHSTLDYEFAELEQVGDGWVQNALEESSLPGVGPADAPIIDDECIIDSGLMTRKFALKRSSSPVFKHLFRYCPDISVDCWLATVEPEEFLQSCGYSPEDIARLEAGFPQLRKLDVRNQLSPKIRFLVRTLGGGRGDIGDGTEPDDYDDQGIMYRPHNLVVSEAAKAAVPPHFFGQRLERKIGPRHAYLVHCFETLPHGRELLENDGFRLREFLDMCGKSAVEFASMLNKWERERCVNRELCLDGFPIHTADGIVAMERSFRRGLLAAARNEPSKELRTLRCTPGDMVNLLLRHGANPAEHDKGGASPLHWAAGTGNIDGFKALLHAANPKASEGGEIGEVILETQGAREGATPLHWAACGVDHRCFGSGGHADICKLMLEEAGDVKEELANANTFTGSTPLMWACWSGSFDVVKLLVSHGADPNLQNSNGCSAAHWACSGGNLDLCRYLNEEFGVDFRRESKACNTPLKHAISFGNADVAKWLVTTVYSSDDLPDLDEELAIKYAELVEGGKAP